jgi:hypothetical protein
LVQEFSLLIFFPVKYYRIQPRKIRKDPSQAIKY